jgi:hypothetical protein
MTEEILEHLGEGEWEWKEKCYIFFGIVSLDKTGIKK